MGDPEEIKQSIASGEMDFGNQSGESGRQSNTERRFEEADFEDVQSQGSQGD